MTNNPPSLYVTLDQVRESQLLTPERLAEVEAAIEARISIPQDTQGRPIETARLADMTPWPRLLFTRMQHEVDWEYLRRSLLAVVLTEEERKLVEKYAVSYAHHNADLKRFEAAIKVAAADWKGWVCDDSDYYADMESYCEQLANRVAYREMEADEIPRFVWAARPVQVIEGLDVAGVTENQLADRGWEDMDTGDLNGVAELQAALDAFVKANESVISRVMEKGTAILLDDTLRDEIFTDGCRQRDPEEPSGSSRKWTPEQRQAILHGPKET